MYGIYDRKNQEEEYNKQLVELKKEEKILKTEIDKLQDEDYIARYAREKYSYSKDGEYILKISEDKKNNEETNDSLIDVDNKYLIYRNGKILHHSYIKRTQN